MTLRIFSRVQQLGKGVAKTLETAPAESVSGTGLQRRLSTVTRKKLYAWGHSKTGAIGSNRAFGPVELDPIEHEFSDQNQVACVQCGYGFTLVGVKVADKRKVYGSGVNSDFQITGSKGGKEQLQKLSLICFGLQNADTKIISLGAGRGHSVVVTDKEGVYAFGSNAFGQCGRALKPEDKCEGEPDVSHFKDINGEKILQAYCGQDHTFFLSDSGKVYSCGFGAEGQTGLCTTDDIPTPTMIAGDILEQKVVKISGKSDSALALDSGGVVYGWGSNEYLQVWFDKKDNQLERPRKLPFDGFGKIVDIACGGSFSMVLNEYGEIFVWGYGILGTGPDLYKSGQPAKVNREYFGCDPGVVAISCGVSHLAALTCKGNLYTWGKNRFGCLGLGHNRNQYFPMKVNINGKVTDVACGMDHTVALVEQ